MTENLTALAERASKPAVQTTEGITFLGLAGLMVAHLTGAVDIGVSKELALTVAAGSLALHQLGRHFVKTWALVVKAAEAKRDAAQLRLDALTLEKTRS